MSITAEQTNALVALKDAGCLTAELAERILGSAMPAAPKAPKAEKPAPKVAPKVSRKPKAEVRQQRTLSTEPGSMTEGQQRRIRNVAKQHGIRVRIVNDWSMQQASDYYAKLKLAIPAKQN